MGRVYSPIVLFAGFAAHSLITNNTSTRKVAYEIGQASLYTGAITLILKTAFGRARPYMNEGTSSYSPILSLLERVSFVSRRTYCNCICLVNCSFQKCRPNMVENTRVLTRCDPPQFLEYMRINIGCPIIFSAGCLATLWPNGLSSVP